MWLVVLLSCLQQWGQGTQVLQNTDLDKEAKREDLPFIGSLVGDEKRAKRSRVQLLPQACPTSPYSLGGAGWTLPQGEESFRFNPPPLPPQQLMMGSLAGTQPKLLHPRVSAHGEALAKGAG